jgi:hypothetical protein
MYRGLIQSQQTSINTEELQKVYIGDYYDAEHGSHFYYSGVIDDVAIYNRVLTPEEVIQHYQNGFWWR